VFTRIALRDTKASLNSTYNIEILPESIAPTKVAFIATRSTASASEMVINGMLPYLGTNMALIGDNTYGKPVGQIALDRDACDDRLRALALKVENADQQSEYYNGLAATVPVTCRATDDISRPLGDPQEGMVRAALDYLGGRSCTPILTASATASVGVVKSSPARGALVRETPRTTPQHEMPGVF
jgi:carboxyl-terminal processing protease